MLLEIYSSQMLSWDNSQISHWRQPALRGEILILHIQLITCEILHIQLITCEIIGFNLDLLPRLIEHTRTLITVVLHINRHLAVNYSYSTQMCRKMVHWQMHRREAPKGKFQQHGNAWFPVSCHNTVSLSQ